MEKCNILHMYANQTDFESWMQQQLVVICTAPYPVRFVSVYTDAGGTEQLNQATNPTL